MRGLTSRGARPCLRQGSTASPSSLPPVRRTFLPATRKSLTSADAFAILLPSVLTAAFVADVTARKERAQEWDRQIAVVEEEAELLRQKQAEAWSRIQCRSVARGAWQQRRMMTTSATKAMEISPDMDPLHKELEIDAADADVDKVKDPDATEDHVQAQKRFERLIATRLALQFMLQLRAGRGLAYAPRITVEPTHVSYTHSMDYLVNELERVNRLMAAVKIVDVPWGIHMPQDFLDRRAQLGQRLDKLTEDYRNVTIHLPDFIVSYAQLIAEFKMGPPLRCYVGMMRVLSNMQNGGTPMAAMTENAVWDSHIRLSSYVISNVLYRHGTETESWRLTEFLTRLTKADSFPRPQNTWFRTIVNDVQICVPSSRNPHLLTALIRATLCNQQRTVAEAYASVFFSRAETEQYSGVFKWYVISNFLESYGEWASWKVGQRWLYTAVVWAQEFLEAGEQILGRVILRMLDFCVACDQREEYEHIMDACVAYRMRLPELDETRPVKVSERMHQIRLDWIERVRLAQATKPSLWRKVYPEDVTKFQNALKDRYDDPQSLPIRKPFHPSDSSWGDKSEPPLAYNPLIDTERLSRARDQRRIAHTRLLHELNRTEHATVGDFTSFTSFNGESVEPTSSDIGQSPEAHPATPDEPPVVLSEVSDTPVNTMQEKMKEIERLKKALAAAERKLQVAEQQSEAFANPFFNHNEEENEVYHSQAGAG